MGQWLLVLSLVGASWKAEPATEKECCIFRIPPSPQHWVKYTPISVVWLPSFYLNIPAALRPTLAVGHIRWGWPPLWLHLGEIITPNIIPKTFHRLLMIVPLHEYNGTKHLGMFHGISRISFQSKKKLRDSSFTTDRNESNGYPFSFGSVAFVSVIHRKGSTFKKTYFNYTLFDQTWHFAHRKVRNSRTAVLKCIDDFARRQTINLVTYSPGSTLIRVIC